jgi:hypothetical protein
MINNAIPRRFGFVIVFLAGVIVGMIGLWLTIQNNIELRYFLLEQPAVDQPQAEIKNFVQAIVRQDSASAVQLWEISDDSPLGSQSDLAKRREEVISTLISEGISPDYMILHVEWWTTCCEPSVTCDSRNAGGARINVQFLDRNGNPTSYLFDVFTREQPYWGDAEGNPPRDWVIRDVYPYEQKPLFWKITHESENRYVLP